jgi:hypothetical protein
VAPSSRALDAARSSTSVAVIGALSAAAIRSASSAPRIRRRRSCSTSCETSKLPGAASGVRPEDPAAFGMIAPGTRRIVAGFSTPSSSACQMPVAAIEAFFRISSTTLLAVRMSGSALATGPRP